MQMQRSHLVHRFTGLVLTLFLSGPALPLAQEADDSEVDSAAINQAIDHGVRYLLSIQHADGSWGGANFTEYPEGATALCVAALLHSGLDPGHQAVQRGAAFVRSRPQRRIYGSTTRILMEDMMGEHQDEDSLEKSAEFIVSQSSSDGYFNYPTDDPSRPVDLSITQYAILAAWFARQNELRISDKLFETTLKAIVAEQLQDGGWSYFRASAGTITGRPSAQSSFERDSTASMTTAGMSTLLFCMDALKDNKRLARKYAEDVEESLDRGYAWLDAEMRYDRNVTKATDEAGINNADQWLHYYLYTVERLGTIADRESLGNKNWYNAGANHLLRTQFPDGGWARSENQISPSASAFALLFLNRATKSRTGEKAYREKKVLSAAEPALEEVDLRIRVGQPSVAWVAAFGRDQRDKYGKRGSFGLRVERVRYYVDGDEVASQKGDIKSYSDTERFEQDLELAPGRHTIQAVVTIAPEPGEGDARVNLESAEIYVDVDWELTEDQELTITELASNLIGRAPPNVSVSSEGRGGSCPGAYAVDGSLASSWVPEEEDAEPWIRLDWQKGLKAETLVLSPATAFVPANVRHPDGTVVRSLTIKRTSWPQRVLIKVNGKPTEFELTGKHREHIPLGKKSISVKSLEVRILGTGTPDHEQLTSTGFAEIELLGKVRKKRRR